MMTIVLQNVTYSDLPTIRLLLDASLK